MLTTKLASASRPDPRGGNDNLRKELAAGIDCHNPMRPILQATLPYVLAGAVFLFLFYLVLR